MGKLEDYYRQNKDENMGEELTCSIKKWESAGDYLIGKLVKIIDFDGGGFDNKCKQYVFKTEEGYKSCILGSISDKFMDDSEKVNQFFAITYKGKIDLDKGRSMNEFSIVDVTKAVSNLHLDSLNENNNG